MMDSQEMKNTLESDETLNSKDVQATESTDKTFYNTTQDVVDRLKLLLNDANNTNKTELDILKQVFYKIHLAEQESLIQKFVDDGGKADDFKPTHSPLDAEMNSLINQIKDKRRKLRDEEEKVKQNNLTLKLGIIEKIKAFVESPNDVSGSYKEFKELQNQWNEIRLLPQSEINKLWSSYQLYVEQFYDKLRLDIEFREYDFKKNLESKTELCELAEALDKETDVISAFHQLQNFHQQWREIGPVAKELRDSIWERFKAASTIINKKHQNYFEAQKEEQENNLAKKTAICETIEAIDIQALDNFKAWNKKTEDVLALQEEWKKIGFTPKKMNNKIFERFRSACDKFFNTKNEFLKGIKDEMQVNLKKKEALCEKAEALKDSTDWKGTSNDLIKLQEEWKKVGPVPRRFSNTIWERFNEACDAFFENRNKFNAEQRKGESENLKEKQELIIKLKALVESDSEAQEVNEQVQTLIKEWNTIGHVPFKLKDEIYKEYRALIDLHFKKTSKGQAKKRMSNFKETVHSIQEGGNTQAIYKERERIVRRLDRMKSELATYDNNLGFLTLSSKKGNSLLDELNRKVDRLKEDIKLAEEQIAVIDKSI